MCAAAVISIDFGRYVRSARQDVRVRNPNSGGLVMSSGGPLFLRIVFVAR